MQPTVAYLDHATTEVDDLASRVAVLKGLFAKQKVSVKLDHYWELEFVRTRFTEFKRRIEALEDDEPELPRFLGNVDTAWKELMQAVDTLITALPGVSEDAVTGGIVADGRLVARQYSAK